MKPEIVLVLITIILFITFFYLASYLFKGKKLLLNRVDGIVNDQESFIEKELSKSIIQRLINPIMELISKKILSVTPKEIINIYSKKIINAGKPFGFGVKDFLIIQSFFVLGIPFIMTVIGVINEYKTISIFLISFIFVSIGIIIPSLILNSKISERRKGIQLSLPDVLDLLTVSVEAGLAFDGALSKVVEKMPGAISQEFEKVLQEIKVGKERKYALKDMAERLNVQELSTFIGSIIQADQLGVSIGNVLRIQSEQMREKRRQIAKEKAMKAPVKMLIPMVLFIFPVIFGVLIGPVLVKVMYTLMNNN